MYKKVFSSAILGVDGTVIGVEADISDGLPSFSMVGYLSSSVREAGERVRTALKNSSFYLPPKRITVNLSPADIRKDGSHYDLAIAVAMLLCNGIEAEIPLENTIIIGELGLDGTVKGVTGILPMVCHCKSEGYKIFIVPTENEREAKIIDGIIVCPVSDVITALDYIQGFRKLPDVTMEETLMDDDKKKAMDFSEIKGQQTLKRGMEIAAAGFHNVLMTGSAGSGKSMLAKRLPTIMPKLSKEESIEVTKIYSICGLLDSRDALILRRPFRSPHHTISQKALVGGGITPKPGEVSLAHNGVLFLDELPEFNKNVLEVLRQPLEDKYINISRLNATYKFPSRFLFAAAMNPCPCGYYPDMSKCKCTSYEIHRYQSKISGPLLDRIDINMEVKPVNFYEIFDDTPSESSDTIRERVEEALLIQKRRYSDEVFSYNSQLEGKNIKKYISLGLNEQRILDDAFSKNALSARGTYRIMKLARTIADLAHSKEIKKEHITEAIYFRNSDMGSLFPVCGV